MAVPIEEENVYGLIEQALQAASSGNYNLSEQLLLRSYGELETELMHNAELRGRVFHLLANNYRDRGKLGVSHDFYDKAWKLIEKENHLPLPLSLYEDMYIQALSEEDFDLALRTQLDLKDNLCSGNSNSSSLKLRNLLRLTALNWIKFQYREAERYLAEYLSLAGQNSVLKRRDEIRLLSIAALFAFRQDRFPEAERLYKQVLKAKDEGLMDEIAESEILSQLGLSLCAQGKHEEAEHGCQKAALLRESPACKQETKTHFRAIADVYCNRDYKEDAKNYCLAAMETYEMGGLKHVDAKSLSTILRRLGLNDDAAILEKRRDEMMAGA